MSLPPQEDPPNVEPSNVEPHAARRPEIHHPRPTRLLARRVTISGMVGERNLSTWVPAADTPNENGETRGGNEIPPGRNPRSPSAPAVLNSSPSPPPLVIHAILSVPPALRSSPRVRFTWDVRYSPDALPLSQAGRRDSITSHHSTSTTHSWHSNPGTTSPTQRIRPRLNTQADTDLELASDMHARLNLNYNSHPVVEGLNLSPVTPNGGDQAFANHPMALESATTPPRSRMLIICRDLLDWFIPIYARDRAVGCTVLEVIQGIYNALQTWVETSSTTSNGIRAVRERRRVEWLREKTVFVCVERNEALARRRVPSIPSDEVFVLTLKRRRE